MRKCRSCGSLLLGEVDACGRCGTSLETVTAGAPASAATTTTVSMAPAAPAAPVPAPAPLAPSFGRLSIPPPGGPALAPGAAPGAPAPQPWKEQWQPATITAAEPTRAPRSTRKGAIALAIVIALGVGATAMHLRSDPLPKGTSAFVSGGGVTYTSPDGAFEVQLPAKPTTDQRTITEDNITATIYSALTSTNDYEIGAASIVFPSALVPNRINAALDAALTQGINGTNGKLVRKNLMTRGALPAIEGQFKAPDGYDAHLLVVARGATMIMVAVHAKTGTDRLYKALENSLLIR